MSLLKYFIVATLLIAAVVAESTNDNEERRQDLVVGEREPGDSLITTARLAREPRPKRWIVYRPFDVPDEYTITQVRVIDQTGGKGGPATYEYGGPGMTRVLLGFTSDANQEINYLIELYAKPYKP